MESVDFWRTAHRGYDGAACDRGIVERDIERPVGDEPEEAEHGSKPCSLAIRQRCLFGGLSIRLR